MVGAVVRGGRTVSGTKREQVSGRGAGGFALYAVLIVVTIGALVAASVVYSAQAQRAAADAAARRVQSRALAWSGVQAALEEMRSSRQELLRGERPKLSEEWSLFVEGDGRRAVARPVLVDGEPAVSESGKLDINTATAEMLANVPGLDAEIAARIVAARGSGKFGSVRELASIEGLRAAFSIAGEAEPAESADAFVPPEEVSADRPLEDLLTVYSFDPNIQTGMGRGVESHIGARRISLRGSWSEGLGEAIRDRYDEGTANIVKTIMEQGTKFERETDLVKVLRRFNSPPADWAEVLDVFCADPGPYRLGRVDVLHAPQEALACLPGFDDAAAEQAVLLRDKLAPEQRLSPCWLVVENILTQEQFEQAFEHICSRSLQWRVVVEAGFVPGEESEREERPALQDRVVLEAVIDVSSERPRVAYLRDVSVAAAARQIGPLRPPAAEPETEAKPENAAPAASPTPERAVSSSRERPARATEEAREESEQADAPDGPGASGVPEKDPRLGRWTPGGN